MPEKATLQFLKGLQKNNNKSWFDEHRSQYDAARKNFLEFTAQAIEATAIFDMAVKELDPKSCVLRMNRDARFTKNKPPYHSAFRMSLYKMDKKSFAASYYFNYEPGNIFMGGGLVGAPTAIVKKVRQEIDYSWKEFEKIVKAKDFKLLFDDLLTDGDNSLKNVPKGYKGHNPAITYLKLNNFIARRWIKTEDISSKEMLKEVVDSFKAAKPFLDFINHNIS